MVAAAIVCGLVINGVSGYLSWVGFALSELTRFSLFLIAAAIGVVIGCLVGVATRKRAP